MTRTDIAKRWGYDFDQRVLIVHMRDDAPVMACKVECWTEGGNSASFTAIVGPGAEIRIPIEAKEGEGVRARFLREYDKEVDSVWVRVAKVTLSAWCLLIRLQSSGRASR